MIMSSNGNNNFKTISVDNVKYRTLLTEKYLQRKPYAPIDPKKVVAFIPGAIRKINVKEGSRVKINDKLMVLEAMKMNNYILSPVNGVIKKIYVKQGDMVPKKHVLLEFK